MPETNPAPETKPRVRRRALGIALEFAAAIALAVLMLVGLLVLASGERGLVDVAASEVAVRVDNLTGETTLLETPGYHFYVPLLQEVFQFDRNPSELVMHGEGWNGPFEVPRLTVRARDGSTFWFDDFTIQFQLDAKRAELVLADTGPGDAWRGIWLQAHARPILRDEFGRFTAQEVADAALVDAARGAAMDRLNEALAPHGVLVTQIVAPKPKFDRNYEQKINARMEVRQKVENLQAQLPLMVKQRALELAKLEGAEEDRTAVLKQKLTDERAAIQQTDTQIRTKADAYAIERVSKGEARRVELLAQAAALEDTFRKGAEGLAAQVAALDQRGDVAVREQLVIKLASIRFDLLPYSQDASPTRVEHLTAALAHSGN